jgi:hypothetical protein
MNAGADVGCWFDKILENRSRTQPGLRWIWIAVAYPSAFAQMFRAFSIASLFAIVRWVAHADQDTSTPLYLLSTAVLLRKLSSKHVKHEWLYVWRLKRIGQININALAGKRPAMTRD